MKKLKLNALQLNAKEVLTREQLKSVTGGYNAPPAGGGYQGGSGGMVCTCGSTMNTTSCAFSSFNGWTHCIDAANSYCQNNGGSPACDFHYGS